MQEAQPSRTALRVAMRRAAHQLFDTPKVLDDPIAVRIIGAEYLREIQADGEGHRISQSIRAFMVARSRFAEDTLAEAVARGVRQYVILGAGLDTFAYRNPFGDGGVRVFEVDHPATQAWKRECLDAADIAVPASLVFSPVDFERQTLADGLGAVAFDRSQPAFFSWLGVTMYLSETAFDATVAFVRSTRPGGGLAFDYAVPRASLSFIERFAFDALTSRVARAGEPFQRFFDPPDLRTRLERAGLTAISDVGTEELNARYFAGRADGLAIRGHLARMVAATVFS